MHKSVINSPPQTSEEMQIAERGAEEDWNGSSFTCTRYNTTTTTVMPPSQFRSFISFPRAAQTELQVNCALLYWTAATT